MKLLNLLFAAIFMFTLAYEAKATEPYLVVGANITDVEDDRGLGYAGEFGLTNGTLAGGIELSNLCIDDDCSLAGALNGRVFIGNWTIRPYLLGGIGATHMGNPLAHYGGGFLWVANDEGKAGSFNIYLGVRRQHQYSSFDDFTPVGAVTYGEGGILLTF